MRFVQMREKKIEQWVIDKSITISMLLICQLTWDWLKIFLKNDIKNQQLLEFRRVKSKTELSKIS